jgi:hypothetical protein
MIEVEEEKPRNSLRGWRSTTSTTASATAGTVYAILLSDRLIVCQET